MLEHPTMAVAVTEAGRIVETNAAWRSLFALPADVSVESHVATLFANVRVADRFEKALQAQLGGDASSAVAEQALTRRDGESFVAEVVFWPSGPDDAVRPLAANAIWQVRDLSVERELRRELRDLEEYHRELSCRQWDMTFVVDRKGRISFASPSVEATLGHRVHALLGEPFMTLLDPAHAPAAATWLRTSAAQPACTDDEAACRDGYRLHVVDRQGEPRVLVCRMRNCFEVPRIAGMVIHARDATAEIADERGAATTRERADALRDALVALAIEPVAPAPARVAALVEAARVRLGARVAAYDDRERSGLSHVSPEREASPPRVAGERAHPWQAVDDIALAEPGVREALARSGIAAFAAAPVAVGGRVRGDLVVADGEPRPWSDGEIDFVVGIAQLIATALAMPDERVAVPDARAEPATPGKDAAASRDALTGLPDRAAARAWLERRVAALPRDGKLTMLSIDLDRLQDVNDRYGHEAGDDAIRRAAATLAAAIGDGGYVARVDGDAFAVVLANAGVKAVEETVAMLLDRLGVQPDEADTPRVAASLGIARLPGDASDARTLWAYADLAMREAKRRGRGQASLFSARLAAAVRTQKALDTEIAAALARGEFVLFYQPQVSLATGLVVGFEALLRWRHPTRGLLLPDAFMDAAAERGLIEPITKSVVGQVCEQLAAWQRSPALADLPVGVNVAGHQFNDRRLPAVVAAALMRSGLPARLLVLELNEQALVGDEQDTARVVKELSRLGVRTAVGGFALAHGALRQLRQLLVAQIKLDRGFVDGLPSDEESDIVVTTIIEIARRLKCQVIAEGVETRAQFERLRTLGCEAGQGFHFGPPLAADDIAGFVANNRASPVR